MLQETSPTTSYSFMLLLSNIMSSSLFLFSYVAFLTWNSLKFSLDYFSPLYPLILDPGDSDV